MLPGLSVATTGSPRYRTAILLVPVGGAGVNVRVVPLTEYVFGFCTTPEIETMIDVVPAGA